MYLLVLSIACSSGYNNQQIENYDTVSKLEGRLDQLESTNKLRIKGQKQCYVYEAEWIERNRNLVKNDNKSE